MRHGILKVTMRGSTFKVILQLLVMLATSSMSESGLAAQLPLFASPEYRFGAEKLDMYRLPAREINEPTFEPRKPSVAPQLADKPFAKLIEGAAREAALDPALVHAVISVESAYNPAARSPKGAIGLMQLMPATAARYGVANAGHSPEVNLKAGTRYLSDLMQLFDNRTDLVLAAYNAGENAVLRYGLRIPPYRETQLYVPAVLAKYHAWREALPVVASGQTAPAPTRIQYMTGTGLNLELLNAAGYR